VLKLTGPQLPVDAEFKPHDFDAVFSSCGLRFGQCFGSKSGYRASHPKCVFVPNANVFSIQHGKLWWGDLDIAKNGPALEQVAHRIRCRLFVVREHDGRRREASLQPQEIQSCAVWCTGGRRQIPNLGKHLSRSGLTKLQLASVLKVSPYTLRRRHDSKAALELNRRLETLAAATEEMAANHGYAKWGHWWVKPHQFLGGDTPVAVRRSAPEVYQELFRPETKAALARWPGLNPPVEILPVERVSRFASSSERASGFFASLYAETTTTRTEDFRPMRKRALSLAGVGRRHQQDASFGSIALPCSLIQKIG
jgi:hypothetical protein